MAKRGQRHTPTFVGAFRVVLRDKRGRFTSQLSKAKSYQLLGPKGGKVTVAKHFPKEAKTKKDRSLLFYLEAKRLDIKNKRRSVLRKVAREQKKIESIDRSLSRARRPKTIERLESQLSQTRNQIAAYQDELLDILEPERITRKKVFSRDGRYLQIVKLKYLLKPPLEFSPETARDVFNKVNMAILNEIQKLWRDLKPSQREFWVKYEFQISRGSKRVRMWFSERRTKLPRFNQIVKYTRGLTDAATERFTKKNTGYFASGAVDSGEGRNPLLIGFEIEYIERRSRKLSASEQKRVREAFVFKSQPLKKIGSIQTKNV